MPCHAMPQVSLRVQSGRFRLHWLFDNCSARPAGAKLGALEITAANKQHLRSAYTRRRPEELAVLTR